AVKLEDEEDDELILLFVEYFGVNAATNEEIIPPYIRLYEPGEIAGSWTVTPLPRMISGDKTDVRPIPNTSLRDRCKTSLQDQFPRPVRKTDAKLVSKLSMEKDLFSKEPTVLPFEQCARSSLQSAQRIKRRCRHNWSKGRPREEKGSPLLSPLEKLKSNYLLTGRVQVHEIDLGHPATPIMCHSHYAVLHGCPNVVLECHRAEIIDTRQML
ncbi:hypothetical protein FCV25MIE_01471, partial [Fagus crenata]